MSLDGTVTEVPVGRRNFQDIALSPDGSHAALTIGPEPASLWTYDFEREVLSAVTSHTGAANTPIWTPDGDSLILSTQAEDQSWGVSLLTLEGGEPARRLADTGTVWTVVPVGNLIRTVVGGLCAG